MSLITGEIFEDGKQIDTIEEPLNNQSHLQSLVEALKKVQKDTNEKLTLLINQGGGDQEPEVDEDCEDEEESDVEPAEKIAKLD